MLLYGASGHGKVILDILSALSVNVRCFLDDDPRIKIFAGLPVFQSVDSADVVDGECCIISVGSNGIRKMLAQRLSLNTICAVHPSAQISSSVTLGTGTVVMANASVNADSRIGVHCIVNTNASVDHDCVLEDYVHVSPNSALAGNVTVGEGAHVGIGACVMQGIRIGRWATVGAGAVVIRDVPDNAVVVGNPARIIKTKQQL
jgi:sugar O-acyltransferase (sialic acid O-acetyltransferase NeuD family)